MRSRLRRFPRLRNRWNCRSRWKKRRSPPKVLGSGRCFGVPRRIGLRAKIRGGIQVNGPCGESTNRRRAGRREIVRRVRSAIVGRALVGMTGVRRGLAEIGRRDLLAIGRLGLAVMIVVLRDRGVTGRLVRLAIVGRVRAGMTGVRRGPAEIVPRDLLEIDLLGLVGMIDRAGSSRVGISRRAGTGHRALVLPALVLRGAGRRVAGRAPGDRRVGSRLVLFGSDRSGPCRMINSGCSAAWLARLLGVQEVPGSNPGSPTRLPL